MTCLYFVCETPLIHLGNNLNPPDALDGELLKSIFESFPPYIERYWARFKQYMPFWVENQQYNCSIERVVELFNAVFSFPHFRHYLPHIEPDFRAM